MHTRLRSQRGASLLEYAILVALIGLASIASLMENGENAADTLCSGAGFIHDAPVKLAYRVDMGCCGYVRDGIGGGFVCVN